MKKQKPTIIFITELNKLMTLLVKREWSQCTVMEENERKLDVIIL